MTITVEIPDSVVDEFATRGKDPARAILEAIALEGYRKDWLSEEGVRRMLGLETRMDVHAFLKENNVYLHYSMADLEHDLREADRFLALRDASQPTEQRVG